MQFNNQSNIKKKKNKKKQKKKRCGYGDSTVVINGLVPPLIKLAYILKRTNPLDNLC